MYWADGNGRWVAAVPHAGSPAIYHRRTVYATPVDLQQSMRNEKKCWMKPGITASSWMPTLRLDTKFGFRINSKKRKLSQTFYLDLQNVTNRENIFLQRYNPLYNRVGKVNQIGFFPDLLYRIQF
jgi:hypothetical protein